MSEELEKVVIILLLFSFIVLFAILGAIFAPIYSTQHHKSKAKIFEKINLNRPPVSPP